MIPVPRRTSRFLLRSVSSRTACDLLVKADLCHYASDLRMPGCQSRKAWEDDRRARIVGKGRIKVGLESAQTAVKGNSATVRFHPVCIPDPLTAATSKTLVFAKQGGKWKIKQESTGS